MSGRVLNLWAAKDEWLRPNSFAAYVFAAICVALATLIRLAVADRVTLLFPTYYVAVLVVSLVGGVSSSARRNLAECIGGLVVFYATHV